MQNSLRVLWWGGGGGGGKKHESKEYYGRFGNGEFRNSMRGPAFSITSTVLGSKVITGKPFISGSKRYNSFLTPYHQW